MCEVALVDTKTKAKVLRKMDDSRENIKLNEDFLKFNVGELKFILWKRKTELPAQLLQQAEGMEERKLFYPILRKTTKAFSEKITDSGGKSPDPETLNPCMYNFSNNPDLSFGIRKQPYNTQYNTIFFI